MNRFRRLTITIAALGALAGPALAQPASPGTAQDDLKHARALSRAFQNAAEKIEPSVVHITSTIVQTGYDFFGRPRRIQQNGVGSGVVVGSGYVLTNNHVVLNASAVSVKLMDGREIAGRVVGTDPQTDLAVVKVDAEDLTPAQFGDSDALQVGEWVLAVGSPFGVFDNTVTAGIVSAKGRTGIGGSDDRFEDFIQTDAAINPGNSGGPLVNLEGQVVGVNSAIASRSGGSVGIGFAIPATIARSVAEGIIKTGHVQRGWLGVSMSDMTPERARKAAFAGTGGVFLDRVIEDSPAQRAGLQPGDVVVGINGRPTPDVRRLRTAITFLPPGTKATLDVVRAGERQSVTAEIANLDVNALRAQGGLGVDELGVNLRTVTADIARQLGYRGIEGVQVVEVTPGGAAADAGLEPGDIIVAVDRTTVSTIDEFAGALAAADPAQSVRLRVIRGDVRGYIDLPPRR